MMKTTTVVVILLVALTTSLASGDEQKIMMKTEREMLRNDNGNRKLVLSMISPNGCVDLDQPCGLLDWCCEGLACVQKEDWSFTGRCETETVCSKKGDLCIPVDLVGVPCCYPLKCKSTGLAGRCS